MIQREQILSEIKEQGIEQIKRIILNKRKNDREEYEKVIQEIESLEISKIGFDLLRESNQTQRKAKNAAIIAAIAAIVSAICAIIAALSK